MSPRASRALAGPGAVAALAAALLIAPLAGCGRVLGPPPLPPPTGVGVEVGMTAADIAGETHDGRPVRLSDFRGRVVLLDFWGDW